MKFQIKRAEPEQFDAVITLIQDVLDSLPQKEWFAADNADFTRAILTKGSATSYIAVCMDTGEIAGTFITVIPGNSNENLGYDIGLSDRELLKVAHMDSAAVLPAYRGHHLQKELMLFAEKELKAAGYQYLCCTIHPDNKYSMNSARSLGYEVVKVCEKYGGYLRAVLMKELQVPILRS